MPNSLSPKQALQDWCAKREIGPQQLAEAIKCTYQHAWNLLSGTYPITLPTLARLLIVYGKDGPAPAIAESMKIELNNLYNTSEPVAA